MADLQRLGLGGIAELGVHFGASALYLGEGESHMRMLSEDLYQAPINAYVEQLLNESVVAPRLSENGGRHFFISRPELYAAVARAVAKVLPEGYRSAYNLSEIDLDSLKDDYRKGDVGSSDLALWAADIGFTNALHADYGSYGTLLTHLEGPKRIHLFPPDQSDLLYMERPENDTNFEAVSLMDGVSPSVESTYDLERFPLFEKAKGFVADLEPGESMFIPCGWPHWVEYFGPALSMSAHIYSDWSIKLFRDERLEWHPRGCSEFHDSSRAGLQKRARKRLIEPGMLSGEEEDDEL
eukprot:TRINITY_DN6613_c0_g1_i2.p1 TRINITY_DN6613_c0_g1~~TRINITY_DN6613_c0_g1_i2.p1  ORF type:complete len:296 (-),score=34.29 TRINITY_DN6613_c0_g1_i2:98-985(-)